MAENINIDIVINAANAAKTLKEQKDALKELNKALDEVKEGTGAFELLNDSANQLKSSMDTLTLSFEDVYGEGVQPLTTKMGELEDRMYAMAAAGQQNTEEFKTLQAEAIKMRRTIQDVDETVDAFAQKGARLQGFVGIVSGIAGGFAVAQGAAALFGKENEAIEKTLLKVQATMAILNGLQELNTLITEKNVVIQRILNTVMKANPIFIILGVITAVTAAYAILTRKTEDNIKAEKLATQQKKALAEEQKKQAEFIGQESSAYVTLVERLRLTNPQSKERLTLIKEINSTYGTTLKNLSDETTFQNQLNKSIDDYINFLKLKYALQANEDLIQKNLTKQATLTKELNEAEADLQKSINARKASGYQDTGRDLRIALELQYQVVDELRKNLSDADARLKGYVKSSIDATNKIATTGLKTTKESETEKTKVVTDESEKREAAYLAELKRIEELNKAIEENSLNRFKSIEDLAFELETFNLNQYAKEFANLKNAFSKETDLLFEQSEKDIADLQKRYTEKERLTKEYLDKEAQINSDYDTLFQLSRDRYASNLYAIQVKNSNELIKLDLDNAKLTYDNNLEFLDKQLEDKKNANNKEKELNKELDDSSKRSLEQQTIDLATQLDKQAQLIIKREAEKADFISKMNETRSTEERLIYQGVIEDIDKLQIKTQDEIKTNGDLLAEKKKQLEVNEKLYGTGVAQKQIEEIVNLEKSTFEQRKKLTEDYYKEVEAKVTDRYKQEQAAIDGQLKAAQEQADALKASAVGYYEVVTYQQEELAKATTQAQKDDIADTIEIYNIKAQGAEDAADLELQGVEKLKRDKIKLEGEYNKTIIDLTKNTTTKINNEEVVRTEKTKEELDKRKADYENFAADAADAVLGLLGAAFNSLTEARIAAIDREKQAQLDALQTEEDAYVKSTEKKTNAEKFKSDKEAEFAKKKADIDKKYEKQKAEAQYKNEVRQWEFTFLQATANFANAMLKAAPNPFLLATTGILGVLQLATITANKPVKTFGKGGLLDGPSHAAGGIATPYGEMEGGEAVINKASTKKFLPILSAINEAGGGVPLVNTSMMANGGVTNVNNNNVDMSNVELLLQAYFNRPIKTYVTSSDVTTAQGVDRRLNDRTSF